VTKVLIQYLGNVSLFLVCRTAKDGEREEFAILVRHRGEHLQRLLVSIQVKAGEQGGAVHQQSPVLHGYCQSFLHYYLERNLTVRGVLNVSFSSSWVLHGHVPGHKTNACGA